MPDKHLDPTKSLLFRTGKLIEILQEEDFQRFKEVFEKYKVRNRNADFMSFVLSLNLLFSLGKIEYIKEKDVIGLIKNET
ncbi:ABC-three component system middle component 6 [Priestia sp. JSM ZJ58]|uniref:ABC-three component system middle component 6 n=1 Tax=Priestia sp. JSM ZJ58 TaxID=3376189 RepID=UPI00379C3745